MGLTNFVIQKSVSADDGIGGHVKAWQSFKTVEGYLDFLTGTDLATKQNAIVEESTHLLILPVFTSGITDKMRVVDSEQHFYDITYADDPMGLHHHNEIYLTFGGVTDGDNV